LSRTCAFVLTIGLLLCSCASSLDTRRPFGDTMRITLRDSTVHVAEAVAVTDSLLCVSTAGKQICVSRLSEIQNVYVHGYKVNRASSSFWSSAFLVGGVCLGLSIVLVEDEGIHDFDARYVFAGLDLIAALAAGLSFSAPEPDVVFSELSDPRQLERFKLHCRYPQGLTAEQWTLLLRSRGQADFVSLPRE